MYKNSVARKIERDEQIKERAMLLIKEAGREENKRKRNNMLTKAEKMLEWLEGQQK